MSGYWNFDTTYGDRVGLEDGSIGAFKDKPFPSLAREICQNSIDARRDKNKPVRVEFHSFSMKSDNIPGIVELRDELQKCLAFWTSKGKKQAIDFFQNALSAVKEGLTVQCLRISDFNTTGLDGDNFDSLLKGAGDSGKKGSTGGSKGVGKNATFVCSYLRTVFYSTYAQDGIAMHEGKAKLARRQVGDDEDLNTTGVGFYTESAKNKGISGYISLDKFVRQPNDFGTDIFIIGLRNTEGDKWKNEIIANVLSSFLVAIDRNSLVVDVDGLEITKEKLPTIIQNNVQDKKLKDKIQNEYYLLGDSADIHVEPIKIYGFEDDVVEVRVVKQVQGLTPTKAYTVVRYPYMQIFSKELGTVLPFSALVVVEDGKLCEFLVNLENIQHTNWSVEDIDDSSEKAFASHVVKEIKDKTRSIINDVLATGGANSTDVAGANEFMPENPDDDATGVQGDSTTLDGTKEVETVVKVGKRPKRTSRKDTNKESEDSNFELVDGTPIEGEETGLPSGKGGGGKHEHVGDTPVGINPDGDGKMLKPIQLGGITPDYEFNPKTGVVTVFFVSTKNGKDAFVTLSYVDAANMANEVKILSATLNGVVLQVEGVNKVKGFDLVAGKEYEIKMQTEMREYFGAEVKIYAFEE